MSKDWKNVILSSSFPLEYEAAKILASEDFYVFSDYKYLRRNAEGINIEFSVDIEATHYLHSDSDDLSATMVLLIECKYRHRNTKWLFLPEPNTGKFRIETGSSIRLVDKFSRFTFDANPISEFDNNIPLCYKGMEIVGDNKAQDAKIREGISQLLFCLPNYFTDLVLFHVDGENFPFFICPILLTTAELIVADSDFSIAKIEGSSDISEIGKVVPYLCLEFGIGPEFDKHCSIACAGLDKLKRFGEIEEIDKILADKGEYGPSEIGNGLLRAHRLFTYKYFTKFIVCNFLDFPKLVSTLKEISIKSLTNYQKL